MVARGSDNTLIEKVNDLYSDFDIAHKYLGITCVPEVINSPLRQDNNPSLGLFINSRTNSLWFKDFGSGEGGSLYDLLAKMWNVSKAKVYEINEIAAKFYHERLYKPSSKIAQEYVKKRKLDNRTLKSFLIGYSGDFDELFQVLRKKGFTDEEILASSLVNRSEKGVFVDRFKNRLMIPIQDVAGRFIAFGGRVLDDSKPKYINSPENIVYSKGRNLFGLNIAKKSDTKKIIIVEGYMDAISLYQRGITNVVASLGTALTQQQGRLLRKCSEQVIIGYDADGAGQAATLRGLDILQNMGCDVRVLQIYGAKDPDEFVIKYGPERFNKCVDNAISLVEFKVKVLKQNLNIENVNDKIKFLNGTAQILSKVDNDIEKEIYIDKISEEYKISKEAIYGEVNKLRYKNSNDKKILEKAPVKSFMRKDAEKKIDESIIKREKMVIYILVNYPEKTFETIKKNIVVDDIKDELNKKIIEKIYEQYEKNININILDLFEEDDEVNYLSGIMAEDFGISDIDKCIRDLLTIYYKEKLTNRRNELVKMLDDKSLPSNEAKELENELNNVFLKLAKVK